MCYLVAEVFHKNPISNFQEPNLLLITFINVSPMDQNSKSYDYGICVLKLLSEFVTDSTMFKSFHNKFMMQ